MATHQNLEERVKLGAFREDLFHRLNVIRLRLPALRERREDIALLARLFLQQSGARLGVQAKRISQAALDQLATFDFPGNVRQLENICHWLTVMAPAQTIEPKDLPPEVLAARGAPLPVAPEPASATVSTSTSASEEDVASTAAPQQTNAPAAAEAAPTVSGAHSSWDHGVEQEALAMLNQGQTEVWDALTQRFEARLIQAALAHTGGRRMEAAQKLGIGRNPITRKIQDLGLE